MKIISVVGARPNYMKIAPIIRQFSAINNSLNHSLNENRIQHMICHTGQHYDEEMSNIFFAELELPKPDFHLGIGAGTHSEQTGRIMIEFEKILLKEKPDLVIVVGDVNSTIACSLAAVKLGIKVAHIEAGLRSFDRSMPEEINRILTDSISDFLFVTEKSGLENLKHEGVDDSKIHFVGHVMIDNLINYLPKIEISKTLNNYNLNKNDYILVTMHRPSNVDDINKLNNLVNLLNNLAGKRKIVFPIHPRTMKNFRLYDLLETFSENIILTQPLGYIDFMALAANAELILTDSGGIQEESTYLNVQCITIRNNTERPITVEVGTNHLAGDNFAYAQQISMEILNGRKKKGQIPELWDGKASQRIAEILLNKFSGK